VEINYIGEHIWAGNLGHAFVILAFVSSLMAAVSYFFGVKGDKSWRNLGRTMFLVHSFSVLGIIGTLMYMLVNHMFEFQYVWQHSNTVMPLRYILSCFWEGQEGSFLLWTFWHVILAIFIIRKGGEWEAPVMAPFSVVQAFLSSMLLGIYFGDQMIGSNPFLLLREHVDYQNLPFVQNANYLSALDGRGLNPLLQNYWMTIHPPILFLGFALTTIPYCFGIAGLWTKKYTEWLHPALPWTYTGIGILGVGILMGGAWAYEALSFGGFWAWDPVENASLVPWLTLVGAGHVMVIQKNKGQSLIMTFVLSLISFILVLYSTFLVRSGILGDSSVHAFTDLGMSGQLLIYLLFFVFLGIGLVAANWSKLPRSKKEEELWSREFWMFIGALVLTLSAFQITVTTSIPVYNALFDQDVAPPVDVIQHYNSWQLPFAILVALFIGFTQFLKYKSTNLSSLKKDLGITVSIAVVLTVIIAVAFQYTNFFYILMAFATLFAITANLYYWISKLKGKLKFAGSSVAHIGFGLVLLGAFISTSRMQTISTNSSGVDVAQLGEEYNNSENILLFKDDTVRMGEWLVSYRGSDKQGINVLYQVDYMDVNDPANTKAGFTLYPRVQTNPRMGNVAEPDTRHFLERDVYTHVTYAEIEKKELPEEGFASRGTTEISKGDTILASNAIVILEDFIRDVDPVENDLEEGDLAVAAKLRIIDITSTVRYSYPVMVIRDRSILTREAINEEMGLKFIFKKIDPETGKAEIEFFESKENKREFIVMKALVFPGINILWAGCIVMALGVAMAVYRRRKTA
jgi:cytochrome c-type biogenesis protein CcmF